MCENKYIYLLYEREFVKTKEPVYKVCSAVQKNNESLQFPKGSIILVQITTNDCSKSMKDIMDLFKIKYKYRDDIDEFYFEGDQKSMISDFINLHADIPIDMPTKNEDMPKLNIIDIINNNDMQLFTTYMSSDLKHTISEKTINLIAKLGRTEMFDICLKECNKIDYSEKTFSIACENGHIDILIALSNYPPFRVSSNKEDGPKYSENAVNSAAANGHIKVLDWLFNHSSNDWLKKHPKDIKLLFKYSETAINQAAANGHIKVLDWFFRHSEYYSQKVHYDYYLQFKYSEAAIDLAAANGHQSVITWFINHSSLEWLKKNSLSIESKIELKYSEAAINKAAANGHTCILIKFRKKGLQFKYSADAIDQAAANGHINVLEWFLSSFCDEWLTDLKYTEDAINLASENGQIRVLQWFFNLTKRYPKKFELKYGYGYHRDIDSVIEKAKDSATVNFWRKISVKS